MLEGGRYALPTPDVSPLDSVGGPGRSLDYLGHHYSSLAQERVAFESGPLPGEKRGSVLENVKAQQKDDPETIVYRTLASFLGEIQYQERDCRDKR